MKHFILIFVCGLLFSCRLHSNSFLKESGSQPATNQEMRETFSAFHHSDTWPMKRTHLVSLLAGRPDEVIAYECAVTMLPGCFLKFEIQAEQAAPAHEHQWIKAWKDAMQQEQGNRRIACEILLAQTYLMLSEMEMGQLSSPDVTPELRAETNRQCKEYQDAASKIYKFILKKRQWRSFHPLCRILRVRYLMDYERQQKEIAKELAALERYNDDYRFLVRLYRFDIENQTMPYGMEERHALEDKRFELFLSVPIDKLDFWQNPTAIHGAAALAIQRFPGKRKIQMLLRILPLYNDNNDLPGDDYRALLYLELARTYWYGFKGENSTRKYLDLALKFADRKGTRESVTETVGGFYNEFYRDSDLKKNMPY